MPANLLLMFVLVLVFVRVEYAAVLSIQSACQVRRAGIYFALSYPCHGSGIDYTIYILHTYMGRGG